MRREAPVLLNTTNLWEGICKSTVLFLLICNCSLSSQTVFPCLLNYNFPCFSPGNADLLNICGNGVSQQNFYGLSCFLLRVGFRESQCFSDKTKLPWKRCLVEPTKFHLKLMRCLINTAYGPGVRGGRNHGRNKEKMVRDREGKNRKTTLSSHGIPWRLTWDISHMAGLFWVEDCYILLLVLSTRDSIGDPQLLRQSFLDFCKWSRRLRAWALTKAQPYSSLLHLCAWKAELEEIQLQAVKGNDECGITIWTGWNKGALSWYSEKQHNTFYSCFKHGQIHCCRSWFITWSYLLS